MTDVTMKQKKR